ncbi:MAG: ferritin-like domain-containing protein, partial [Microthrixaceae bacterium]|nr:ferritin-like domain-containing protein [Microthrixaceae bacterium]
MTDVAGTDVPTAGADSLEALMGRTNSDADAVIHTVRDNADVIFTWSYDKGERASLSKLYEKAKGSQWNGTTDLPWETEVDQESFARSLAQMDAQTREARGTDLSGTVFAKWGTREWEAQAFELQNWTLSQFLHGEQGALACSAKIVETVPWIDAKYYASTQVMDEARHVEVFARYLDEKMSGHYPVNVHLRELLDDILSDSRWDMTYLGMQIMVEGLALASF